MAEPVHLVREHPAARQAAGIILIGAVLTALGTGGLIIAARTEGQGEMLASIVATGFVLFGVVLLVLGLKSALIVRLPETKVELDRDGVRAGIPFRVTVRQPGPIRLRSLRVNVVAEQITRYEVWRRGRRRTEIDRHLVHQHNVVDVKDLAIARGEEFTAGVDVTVPAFVTLVDIEGRKTVVWRLEVWGRVRGWVDFGHPFVITVSGVRTVVEGEAAAG
jgi:stage V sporulation protein SpoVS